MTADELLNEFAPGHEGVLFEAKARVQNKEETKCDVEVTAKSKFPFPIVINPVYGDFTVYKKGDILYFHINRNAIIAGEVKENLPLINLKIQYDGKILKHNAHNFDVDSNSMSWNCNRLNKDGIFFLLEQATTVGEAKYSEDD